MSDEPAPALPRDPETAGRAERMAEAVRLVVTSRERAPRPPRMEHALKRLIWRYSLRSGRGATGQERSTNATR